jgi:hypothetical protein
MIDVPVAIARIGEVACSFLAFQPKTVSTANTGIWMDSDGIKTQLLVIQVGNAYFRFLV